MIGGVDSSFYIPSSYFVSQAAAAGVGTWGGYLATRVGVKLARPWSRDAYEIVRPLGMPLAFASGWDDPVACRDMAAAWNVRLALDVEDGIRGNGPWVQPWLDASGAGLYGNYWVHAGRNAPFHVLSAYPGSGDPRDTWNERLTPRPNKPCGWQWVGTHYAFGGEVDEGDYDDWFRGEAREQVTQEQFEQMFRGSPLLRQILTALFRVLYRYEFRRDPGAAPAPWNYESVFQADHMLDPNFTPDEVMIRFIMDAAEMFGAGNTLPVHPDQVPAPAPPGAVDPAVVRAAVRDELGVLLATLKGALAAEASTNALGT